MTGKTRVLCRTAVLLLQLLEASAALPRLPLLPGAPVEFDLGMQDGKPSAVGAQQRLDLHGLCRAGFAGMSCTRQVEPAPINLKAESGHSLVGCFAGLVTGRHGMGGAEFVALNLAKDLGTSFQGREQGGRRGAKAAMLAGFQRTQHGFLQYAQRLSDNSAKLWLSAETSACCVLVFGPDKNGTAAAVLGDAGSGGRGLVVARDGQITSRLGAAGPGGEEKPAQDSLKVFEHGLKGPSINFPAMPGARGPAPKGFGTHAYSEKGGLAAGLAVTLDVCQLDWANDALIILASDSFWAIAEEEKAAKSALAAVVAHQSPEQALMQDVQAMRRGAKADDLAVTVLCFTWVDLADGGKTRLEIATGVFGRHPALGLVGEAGKWGITSLKQLSWTSPERLGKAIDSLPFGSAGPSEGHLADLRALNVELWEARRAEASAPPPKNPKRLGVLEAAAGFKTISSRSTVDEEATRVDLEARKAALLMMGDNGRLLREKLHQHFQSVSAHAFSTMLSHLPIHCLSLAKEQARHESWFHLLTDDVLHTSLLRQDWSIRSAFMSGHIPPTNLVPIYGAEDGMLRTSLLTERSLSCTEQSHPRVEPLHDNAPKATLRMPAEPGSSSLMPNLRGFKLVFDLFTKGILRGVFDLPQTPGQKLFVAGGAVLACAQLWQHPKLQPLYKIVASEVACFLLLKKLRIGQSPQVLQNIMEFLAADEDAIDVASAPADQLWLPGGSTGNKESWGFASSDIDVFICCETEDEGKQLLRQTVHTICKNLTEMRRKQVEKRAKRRHRPDYQLGVNSSGYSRDIRLLRSANALSIWGGWPFRTVQVMVILYKRMDEVLNFFDLDCISMGFDGQNILALPRTIRSLQTGYNFVEPAKLRRWSTGPRIVKYKSRGFGTVFFEICKHHPRCDLPSTLDEETARRIAALNGFVSASQDLGYGEVELPFVQRMLLGMHLDQYMEQHEDRRKSIRQSIDFQSKGLWNLPDSDLVAGKYRYISGDESASETSIETLLSVNMEKDGLPGLRWKNVDLWESRRGNEFLPRCYMCRERIDPSATLAERPRLCGACEALSRQKLAQEADLTGKTAIVTGGRVNIGYATALKLLRMGCQVAVTTRFPRDCLRRYSQEKDSNSWLPRLWVYGADFRNVPTVAQLGKHLAKTFPKLDILINNAAQTVKRPAAHYKSLIEAEQTPLDAQLEGRLRQLSSGTPDLKYLLEGEATETVPAQVSDAQLPVPESKDLRAETSWTAKIGEVSWVESVEVQVINVTAPFVLLSELKSSLLPKEVDTETKESQNPNSRRRPFVLEHPRDLLSTADNPRDRLPTSALRGYFTVGSHILEKRRRLIRDVRFVVNVSSQEGSFRALGSKGANQPHTNMAKASLNMMTCSVADEFSRAGVAVVSVDTGWISRMKPEPLAEAEPHVQSAPPLSAEERKNPKPRVVQEVDDIFAQPGDGEGQEASEEEEEEEDDSEEEARGSALPTECMNVGSGELEEVASMRATDPQPAAEDESTSHVDSAPAEASPATVRRRVLQKSAPENSAQGLLASLDRYSLDTDPASNVCQTSPVEKEPVERKAKAKNKVPEEKENLLSSASATKKADAKAKAKAKSKASQFAPERADDKEPRKDVSGTASPTKECKGAAPSTGASKGDADLSKLNRQFEAALAKLDDLACTNRARVMPAF
eukprot:s85_g13.t1